MTIVIERFTDKEPIKFTNITEVPKVVTLGNIAYFEVKQDKQTSLFILTDIRSYFVLN